MGGPRGRLISDSDRHSAVGLIQEARASGARLIPACEVLCITSRTYQRWVKDGGIKSDGRPEAERPKPANSLSEEEKQYILSIVNSPEYASRPPSQIVPSLADKGEYIASESTYYRILRASQLQKHRGSSKAPTSKLPTTYVAKAPNQVWTWDITWLPGPILGVFFKLYLIIDIFSRFIVGWEVWDDELEMYAMELIRRAVATQRISIVPEVKEGFINPLVLHQDNGSPMKGANFIALLHSLGIVDSFSRPRVSNDNPYSEAHFRTLKYRPNYKSKGYKDIEEAREWVNTFVHWYNEVHRHSGINFVTPHQRHYGEAERIIANRIEVYEEARVRHPERWSGNTRNWNLPAEVYLNPEKSEDINLIETGLSVSQNTLEADRFIDV